jgi:hypothetical protein
MGLKTQLIRSRGDTRLVLALAVAPALLFPALAEDAPVMTATKDASGAWDIADAGKPVLRYNYQTVEPAESLQISPGNRKYARPRSDYIHPLYGPDGEVLTKDWSVDHPHHRGIYWAWPEVDNGPERGDLHALQRVVARPTGKCTGTNGAAFADIEAENEWRWEDKEPIVLERALIRAHRATDTGRFIDLTFYFVALKDGITIARRGATNYGGLNMRLAAIQEQKIGAFTDPADANPRMAWAEISGLFPNAKTPAALTIFQPRANPCYPGDWVQFDNLNWLQPTFPTKGTRYTLKKGEPLVLRFRLWIHPRGGNNEKLYRGLWQTYDTECSK